MKKSYQHQVFYKPNNKTNKTKAIHSKMKFQIIALIAVIAFVNGLPLDSAVQPPNEEISAGQPPVVVEDLPELGPVNPPINDGPQAQDSTSIIVTVTINGRAVPVGSAPQAIGNNIDYAVEPQGKKPEISNFGGSPSNLPGFEIPDTLPEFQLPDTIPAFGKPSAAPKVANIVVTVEINGIPVSPADGLAAIGHNTDYFPAPPPVVAVPYL